MIAKTFFNLQRFTNIYNNHPNKVLLGSNENDSIRNESKNVTIESYEGDDTISSEGDFVNIFAGNGKNWLYGSGNFYNMFSGSGDDFIVINPDSSDDIISSGAGNDTISVNYGKNLSVNGGDGNDIIDVGYTVDYVTIFGGDGNDKIDISRYALQEKYKRHIQVNYNYGDGNDTIFCNSDYNSDYTLKIETSVSYSTVYGGNNLYVKFDDSNSIVLTGISQSELGNLNIVTIQGGEENNSTDNGNNSSGENNSANNGVTSSETFTYSQLTDAQKKEVCENSLESLKSLLNVADDIDVGISSDDFDDQNLFNKSQGWTKFAKFVANIYKQGHNNSKLDKIFSIIDETNNIAANTTEIISGKKPMNDLSATNAIMDSASSLLETFADIYDLGGIENEVLDLSLISSVAGLASNVIVLADGSKVTPEQRQNIEKAFIDVAYESVKYLKGIEPAPFGPLNSGMAALTGIITGFDQFLSSNAKYKSDGLATATQNAWIDAFSTGIHEAASRFTFGADDAIFEGVRWLAHNLMGKGDQYEKSDLNYMEWLGTAVKISVLGEVHGNDKDNGIETVAEQTEIVAGAGNDFIIKGHSQVTIYGGADNDTVGGFQINGTEKNYIDLGDGNDSVTVYDKKSTIYGGNGDDTIRVMGIPSNVINVYATNNKIYGDDGNDIIYLSKAVSNTVRGGAGNDTIGLENSRNTYIEYREGDGRDSIVGYGETDTIRLTRVSSSYSTVESGNNVLVYVGNNNEGLILVDAKGKNINISADNTPKEEDMNVLGIKQESINGEKLRGSETSSTNNSSRNYSGGNSTITNYVSEEVINYQTDFTGIGFNNSDFMVNSSSGTLTIQNARDKLMNFAVNDNSVARAYMASGYGDLDGSSFSQLEVIIGGNDASNVITAGSGDSSLWGGSGGVDNLIGGAGQDIFFFGKYDGLDVISNASSSDKVHLYDVNLSDIISANVSGGVIYANFNTGGVLKINCTENLSPTFQLADGSQWKFNQSSGQWQND